MTMCNKTMTRLRRSAGWALAAIGIFVMPAAYAGDYYSGYSSSKSYSSGYSRSYGGGSSYGGSRSYSRSYYGGGSRGGYHGGGHGGHYGGHHGSKPTPTRTVRNERRYHYSNGYRDGGSGYGWLNFRRGEDNRTGYTGANTSVNRPHRSDWNAKLNAQRRWDADQYKQSQQARGAECGFTTSPSYCYKLEGPYPPELRVVRY